MNSQFVVRSLFILLVCMAAGFPLLAQVEVEVSTVPHVGLSIGGAQGGAARDIVAADLRRTGTLVAGEPGAGDFSATGEASDAGLTGKLVKKTGEEDFSQPFSGSLRAASHHFADAITKAVTGVPGFASSRLAFISNATGSKELYLADIDGFGARPITHDGTICASPALNHEGTRLAYTSYKSGYADIYLIDLNSGARSRIAYFPGINSGPSFSPDGSRLAMTLSKDGNPEIYTMPAADGATPTRLTRTRGAETSPSWSPGGDQLVYSSDDHGTPQLFVSSANSIGEMDHLATGNSYCTRPDWSPDGKFIAYTTRIAGQFQIGVYNVALRTPFLTINSGGQDPAWTADSRHLVFSNHGHLALLDVISHQVLPINISVDGCGEPTVSR